MSTSVQPQQPSSGSSPIATSPSLVAGGGSSSTAASSPEPYRYGQDAPAWAQGKTAAEVLGIAEQQNSVIRGYIDNGRPQPPQPQYQQPNQQPYTNQYSSSGQQQPSFNGTEYVTGDDIQRLAPRLIQDAVSPQLAAVVDMTAQGNLAHVQRDNAAIFQKYGPEVNIKLANVPKNLWTVDNLRTVVNLVKADHVEELASEIASQRFAGLGAELRSNGSPTPPVASNEPQYTLKGDLVSEDFKKRAAETGLTDSAIAEFCRANEMTVEDWYKAYGKTAITEVAR